MDDVIIVGGGITGLALAMNLERHGIGARVYERAPEIKEIGVGITLLPHAMREFGALGLGGALLAAGIENIESCFYNRFGQLIYKEPRGKLAGYPTPEVGIHRGRLHKILYDAALRQLGPQRIVTGATCVGLEQDDSCASALLVDTQTGRALSRARGSVVIACDGINSAIRKQLYPDDKVAFAGINTWRGVARHAPILTGRSYLRIGSILTGKIVIYPIIDNVDGAGRQLVNWMAEIQQDTLTMNDWNQAGKLEDFHHIYAGWRFDWLDVGALIASSDLLLQYPMVDKDPLPRWTFDRVTLAGDAAHPMYPRGSNGAAQGALDARALADCLAHHPENPRAALKAYEDQRLAVANKVVETNRRHPPDFINIKVEQLVGDRPFDSLDRYITQAELKALSDDYKRVAGFALTDVGAPPVA